MAEKLGNGGHSLENYDPATGKYIEDGKPNSSHNNPNEQILNSMGLTSKTKFVKEYKIPGLDMNLYSESAVKDVLKLSYDKLIDNDEQRLHRYKEWTINSNSDYKKYIYDDLENGKKEATLNIWYNSYKLKTGKYDLKFEDFLNTPITLYRATNKNEDNDYSSPFFSYAQDKKTAERFLEESQSLNANRTGKIETIFIKPIDTLGMLPSDEDEIIVSNNNYKKIINKVNNIIKNADNNNVTLPYDKDKLINMFSSRNNIEKIINLENMLNNFIEKNKK